jgi:hypothetical protein
MSTLAEFLKDHCAGFKDRNYRLLDDATGPDRDYPPPGYWVKVLAERPGGGVDVTLEHLHHDDVTGPITVGPYPDAGEYTRRIDEAVDTLVAQLAARQADGMDQMRGESPR